MSCLDYFDSICIKIAIKTEDNKNMINFLRIYLVTIKIHMECINKHDIIHRENLKNQPYTRVILFLKHKFLSL